MNINWLQIITTILLIVAGYFITYFKKRVEIIEQAKAAINAAEQAYEDVSKAGGKKMEFCVDYLYTLVPVALKPFITRDLIQKWVQMAFDSMAAFADKQLDKLLNRQQETEG